MRLALSLLLLSLGLWNCQSTTDTNQEEPKELSREERFSTFQLDNFKAVVVRCDLGRLKLALRQDDKPRMEVHKSFEEYVSYEAQGDTLFIHTKKTPKQAEGPKIQKNIELYLKNLNYLESNTSKIMMSGFTEQNMKIVNKSNSLRLLKCDIRKFDLINSGRCNLFFDSNNDVDDLYVKLNSNSKFTSHAYILNSLTLEAKSLKNTNFDNFPEAGFKWIKK